MDHAASTSTGSNNTFAPSTSNVSSKTLAKSTKFKIEQAVPSNSVKKGPYAVLRGVDPKDVVIKRRCGEGSKPLFERDDINIHRQQSKDYPTSPGKVAPKQTRRYSSSSSSSPERYRQSDPTTSTQTTSTKTRFKHIKRRDPDKVPYFLDEKREEERLMRTYGTSIALDSSERSHKSRKTNSSTLRSRSQPKNFTSHSKSASISSKKYKHSKQHSSTSHERHSAYSHHRSTNESERQRYRSPSIQRRSRHHRRSKSRSRSRSHSNDHRRRRRSLERRDHSGDRAHDAPKPTPQIMPFLVPVDAYGYPAAYPTWPQPPAWHTAAQGAPRFVAPYPLPPVMSPYVGPAIYPQFRPPLPPPPPYEMPYTPRMFGPQRFASRFPPRGNFRPRHY